MAPFICILSADAPCLLAGKVTFPASVSLHGVVILMMHGLPSHMHQPSLAACICMHATLLEAVKQQVTTPAREEELGIISWVVLPMLSLCVDRLYMAG